MNHIEVADVVALVCEAFEVDVDARRKRFSKKRSSSTLSSRTTTLSMIFTVRSTRSVGVTRRLGDWDATAPDGTDM